MVKEIMNRNLLNEALIKIVAGIIIMTVLIFLPAGTFLFSGGLILMTVLFVPMIFAGFFMMVKKPELLRRRLKGNEKQKGQRVIVFLSAVMFAIGFIVAGLDFRFGWSSFPRWLTVIGIIAFLSAYLMYGEVIGENEYLSRTIEVDAGQKVIDTGLYSVVRHPMYFATVILFLSMPVILGSFCSFVIFLLYPFLIVKRIKFEEEFLEKELDGYIEYKQKVKYRLIPHIW